MAGDAHALPAIMHAVGVLCNPWTSFVVDGTFDVKVMLAAAAKLGPSRRGALLAFVQTHVVHCLAAAKKTSSASSFACPLLQPLATLLVHLYTADTTLVAEEDKVSFAHNRVAGTCRNSHALACLAE